jgi:hypothetical protein
MAQLNDTTQRIRVTRGTVASITAAENLLADVGTLLYVTDENKLYVHNGTEYKPVVLGATGTFTTNDSKTVTVVDGLIVSII